MKKTLAEKLRFLADRAEDGQEFYWGDVTVKFDSEGKLRESIDGEWIYSYNILNVEYIDVKLKPQWEFTEDEKVILRNLPDEFRWIARDKSDTLFVYTLKPTKANQYWSYDTGDIKNLDFFNHIFQSIQWSDDEPCEFRKYI